MKYLRIVLPVFLGTLIYSLLALTAGPKGYWPYSQLEQDKNRLQHNLESLQTIHTNLESQLANLTSDPDTISVYAHELGYIHEGEQLIKLADFNGGINRSMVPGKPIESRPPVFLPEWICKAVGVLFAALAFFCIEFVFRKHSHDSEKRRQPVY